MFIQACSVFVEAVVIDIVVVDIGVAAKALIITVIIKLKITEHAFPIQPFLCATTQFGQSTLVLAFVIRLIKIRLWHEGAGVKKLFCTVAYIIPLMTFHVFYLS